ncbi:MAG TPA: photoactive yellow protein [Leptospiraceae bacterium]|nr:photoactive yellow protein [Leptospiraceae bacterium]HMW06854.1 photoactive yellow protein [Leptospiraceae bacterium]HMX32244.1 photoactive yellow protein [Leptospiraceae bacterium]HMY32373.1 photoactive yellow protein [Leptospiraceae bacterium]HMZ65587.1 photoactive yellow protein [Leptospiraceae bacterium]
MEDFAKGILYNLGYLSRDQADAANFGIIKVDDQGQILLYNRYESELAGVPVHNAEGKNFFTQVAICTNNRLFFGKFKDGVSSGHLDISFNYVFTYKMKPTNVVIQLYRDQASATNWIFVKKK